MLLFVFIAMSFTPAANAKICSPSVPGNCKAGDTHTVAAYPREDAVEVLELARKTYKADLNIFTLWAEKSPLAVKAWIEMDQTLMNSKVLSAPEIQTIGLVTSNLNRCIYCMHFHTVVAQMHGVNPSDAQEMRDGGLPLDRRLRVIAQVTKLIHSKRGQLNAEDREWCISSAISDAQLYEITAHVGLITCANMLNLIQMPVTDDAFRSGVDEFRMHRPMMSHGTGAAYPGGHSNQYPHHIPPPVRPRSHGDL